MPSVVDIFCGVGGLTHGFIKEGFNVVAGLDIDPTCKYPYKKNNPGAKFHLEDISALSPEYITALYPPGDVKILVGCTPCQPFSPYANRNIKKVDEQWKLLRSFAQLIQAVRPEIISMENVPELAKHSVFEEFLAVLNASGYSTWWKSIECVDYGVPQTRTRLVLLASRFGPIALIPRTHPPSRRRTVRHAIGRLEPIEAGKASRKDRLHRASRLSDLNLKRIMHSKPGGSWRRDWPEELLLECHKRDTGQSYGSVYGRMTWDEPAPTMTTQCNGIGNGRFGHPEQNRAISIREAALFQTFPRNYEFLAPDDRFNFTVLARHIGNAVPVRMGRAIARSIRKHLETNNV